MIVDINLPGITHRLGLTDDTFEVFKLFDFYIREFHQLVVVEASVFESIADNALNECTFELLKHTGYIEGFHLGAFNGDNRAKIQELAHCAFLIFSCLTGFGRKTWHGGENLQCAVRSKVENVAVFLDSAIDGCRSLHTEDGLHISRGSSVEATRQHQHTHPRLDTNPRSKTTTRQCNSSGCVGVFTDGGFNHFECFAVFLVLVAVTGYVDNLEVLENGVGFKQCAQRLCRFHTWEHPQRVTEDVAVFIVGERICAFGVGLR